jgi:hypothetical protein
MRVAASRSTVRQAAPKESKEIFTVVGSSRLAGIAQR